MGNQESRPKTVRVTAPRTMNPGEGFYVTEYGAKWTNLKAPPGGATKLSLTNAICDEAKIEVTPKTSAEAGEEFEAGDLKIVAPPEGVTEGEKIIVGYDAIISTFIKNDNQMKIPSSEFTDVKEHITDICASLSDQIYVAKNKKEFRLESSTTTGNHATPVKARVVILDTHGDSHDAIPTFAVAVTGKTMIMGWRGTNTSGTAINTVLDFITDAAIGPRICPELGKARSGIRMHNAMSSFAASDLDFHQDAILEEIVENKIDFIVFTGHSLGGGIACTAHTILQAQMDGYNDSSSGEKWFNKDIELNGKKWKREDIELKSVVFSGVMSLFGREGVVDDNNNKIVNKESDLLLEKVSDNTVNMFCGADLVPRFFSQYEYLEEVLDAIDKEDITKKLNLGLFAGAFVKLLPIDDAKKTLKTKLIDIVPAIKHFRHIGKLLYYKDKDSTAGDPEELEDTGPIGGQATKKFNHYTYASYGIQTNDIDAVMDPHGYPKSWLASYVKIESIETNNKKRENFLIPDDRKRRATAHDDERSPQRQRT